MGREDWVSCLLNYLDSNHRSNFCLGGRLETYWTSDLHWHHARIQEFTGRPWNVEDQTEALINIWNAQVKPGDTVYHLGDFCFGLNKAEAIPKIVKRLNGNIGFILGNHDTRAHYEQLKEMFGGRVLFVEDFKRIRVSKKEITLCHYPLVVWENSHHGKWSLHGHCHGSYEHPGRSLDVGLDNAIKVLGGYRLFTFDDLNNYFRDREPWMPDHHNVRTT
jgi:calcineurin-like phosphoesterase family protein